MNINARLKIAIIFAGVALATQVPACAEVTLHVAPVGSDANPGTASRPFATLERARNAVRALKRSGKLGARGVTVGVRGGIHELSTPLELTVEDSGSSGAPVVWRSRQAGAARLVGGKFVSGWQPVTDPRVLARLDPTARGHVWQADLRAQGIVKEVDVANPPGFGSSDPGMEVFFNEQPMTIARWPNEGVAYVRQVEGGDYNHRDAKADPTPRFVYDGDRP